MLWYKKENKVYLYTDHIKIKQISKKLDHKKIRSFKIKRNVKNTSYELKLFKMMRIHSVFHVTLLESCHSNILLQKKSTSVKFNEEYKVKSVLMKQIISDKSIYLIK